MASQLLLRMAEIAQQWQGWHDVAEGVDLAVGAFNARRAWCQANLGEEFREWHHVWTNNGYVWRFRILESRVLFQLVWR
jgi:hypothetical protein